MDALVHNTLCANFSFNFKLPSLTINKGACLYPFPNMYGIFIAKHKYNLKTLVQITTCIVGLRIKIDFGYWNAERKGTFTVLGFLLLKMSPILHQPYI